MIRKIITKIRVFKDEILPKLFIYNKFLASFYYLFFSNKFKREQYAVLKGKLEHEKSLKDIKKNFYTLVRNIHRIEKGLLMIPKRPVFALNYIEETITTFINLWTFEKSLNDLQYKWFYDVLNSYFETSGAHPFVDKQAKLFYALVSENKIIDSDQKMIPYLRNIKSDITYDAFLQLVTYRRSVRWFQDRNVPHNLIDKAILAANQSPSACNRQPFEYRIIDEPELLNKVRKLPMGVAGYDDNIPMLIVAIGNLNAYFHERDRHLIYIDASLANMTFMLALETLGLSSCSINWPDVENLEMKMSNVLKLETHQRVIMCMAVGYPNPKGKVAYSQKKNINKLRKYN